MLLHCFYLKKRQVSYTPDMFEKEFMKYLKEDVDYDNKHGHMLLDLVKYYQKVNTL